MGRGENGCNTTRSSKLRWCRSISAFQSLASPSIRPRRCIQNVGQYHRCCCTNCLNDTQNKFIFRRGRPREHTTCTIAARFCCTLDTTGPVDIRRLLNPSIRYIALPFVASSIHIIARFSCCRFSRCTKKVCVCGEDIAKTKIPMQHLFLSQIPQWHVMSSKAGRSLKPFSHSKRLMPSAPPFEQLNSARKKSSKKNAEETQNLALVLGLDTLAARLRNAVAVWARNSIEANAAPPSLATRANDALAFVITQPIETTAAKEKCLSVP